MQFFVQIYRRRTFPTNSKVKTENVFENLFIFTCVLIKVKKKRELTFSTFIAVCGKKCSHANEIVTRWNF